MMAAFNAKEWLRTNTKLYLTVLKAWVIGLINPLTQRVNTLETSVTALSSVTGNYKGLFATVAAMPTGTGVRNGDWAILNVDDDANESGIWVKAAVGWQFAIDLPSFSEIRTEIIASDAEATAGASTQKVLTVKQVVDKITAAMQAVDLSTKANVAGLATQSFEVADAEAGTKQALNASQFGLAITPAEAQADWDAA